jgi:MOSC domain-containing protein
VAALWRYPVKSMLGEELEEAEVTEHGLLGDRRFAVVDPATGKVAGAKNPTKWGNFFALRAAYAEPPRAGSGWPAVRVTLPDGSTVTDSEPDFVSRLSAALGREVAFQMAEDGSGHPSAVAEAYWPDVDGMEFRNTVTEFELRPGSFFDAAPLHLLTSATLDRLSALYPEGRFDARRFRPNLVVATGAGEEGFVEDGWVGRTLTVGEQLRLAITRPCSRCVMTTLPQEDLPKDSGILRTVARHHDVKVGVYAAVIRGGTARLGDPVSLD